MTMRRFRKPNVRTRILVFCIAALSSLYASSVNPVSWSLQTELAKVAPGSTMMLRLHAQIEDGYHLYSLTTPSGGPIKTRAWLQSSPDIKDVRVYQPKPDGHQDPTLNVRVETFKGGVDFLLTAGLVGNVNAGDKVVTVSVRYQVCSDQICLPPVTKIATTTITVQPGTTVAKASVPNGYQLVGDSSGGPARERLQSRDVRIDVRFVSFAHDFGVLAGGDGHDLAHEDDLRRDVNQFASFLHTGLASAVITKQQAAGKV
jgi:thiol:disulfide interchange protein DsbD